MIDSNSFKVDAIGDCAEQSDLNDGVWKIPLKTNTMEES